MTDGTYTEQEFGDFEWAGPFRASILPRALLCVGALVASACLGLTALHAIPARAPDLVAGLPTPVEPVAAPGARPIRAAPLAMPAPARFAALRGPSYLAPNFTAGTAPVVFAQSAALRSWFEPRKTFQTAALETTGTDVPSAAPRAPLSASADAEPQPAPIATSRAETRAPETTAPETTAPETTAPETTADTTVVPPLPPAPALLRDIPMPSPRPAFLQPSEDAPAATGRRRMAPQVASLPTPEAPAAAPAQPSFFDRLFRPQEGPALAYAAPDDSGLMRGAPDRFTAVYNIASHTVTLPDGTRLEAHSGIGPNKDNPRSVAEHMRGATPPAIYDLTAREALFHGVAALRLNPVGDVPPYGRLGLLAHSYMLGPRGDSNGCVVFRDYAAFRRAYDAGQIRRLVVVAGA